jgi:hypothetical protein
MSFYWSSASRAAGVLALCTASMFTAEQSNKSSPPIPLTGGTAAMPSKAQLTSRQKVGLRLLNVARSEASALQPDMRAFVLWQVSHGYARIDPGTADSILREAFRATFSIDKTEDRCSSALAELCGPKYWLQREILRDLIARSKGTGDIESLLASADSVPLLVRGGGAVLANILRDLLLSSSVSSCFSS